MKKLRPIAILLSAILLLNGCQMMDDSFLNKINATQVEKENGNTISTKIIEGKTTKNEINKMFGKPQSRSIDSDGTEAWTYHDVNFNTKLASYIPIPIISSVFGGTTAQSKSLIILFNSSGIVQSYNFSEDGY